MAINSIGVKANQMFFGPNQPQRRTAAKSKANDVLARSFHAVLFFILTILMYRSPEGPKLLAAWKRLMRAGLASYLMPLDSHGHDGVSVESVVVDDPR